MINVKYTSLFTAVVIKNRDSNQDAAINLTNITTFLE